MIYRAKSNDGYFKEGEFYTIISPSINKYNDNWLQVFDKDGRAVIEIQKSLIDFYFISIEDYRDEQINKLIS